MSNHQAFPPSPPPPGEMAISRPALVEQVRSPLPITGIGIERDGTLTIALDGIGHRARFDSPDRLCELGWLILAVAVDLDKARRAAGADLDAVVAQHGAQQHA